MAALEGLKVLDLSRLLPGPYCTLLLADLGADVLKIEAPSGGDPLRYMPPLLGDDESALFHSLHRNKRSCALDLKSDDGRAALLQLVETSDVLVEGFRPGVLARLRLAPETLLARNPKLIVCSITGFGQTGPDASRAGHDLGYLARAGILGFAGERDGKTPSWPGAQLADVGGGALFSAFAILAALRERDRTGVGRHLDVSMTEGALAFVHMHLSAGPLHRGEGPLNGGYPCYGVYRTRDGRQMALGALEPKFWLSFCDGAGCPELATRGYDRDARSEVEALFAARDFEAWCALSRATDCCLEPVWEGDEVFFDPQHVARGMFTRVDDERFPGGGLTELRVPVGWDTAAPRPAPALGAHTREALEAAGAPQDLIERVAPRGAR